MDARQCRSKSKLTKLHERAGLQLRQIQCLAKRLNNRNPGKDYVVCSAECLAVHPWKN